MRKGYFHVPQQTMIIPKIKPTVTTKMSITQFINHFQHKNIISKENIIQFINDVKILNNKTRVIDIPNFHDSSPFQLACLNCTSKLVKKMINMNDDLDINTVDTDGRTALHYSIFNNNYNVIQILVEAGINIYKLDNFGNSALFYAYKFKNIRGIKGLLQI
jgi:ankyrin repeat protein